MIIALFPNTSKKISAEIAPGIASFLQNHGVTVVAEDEEAHLYGASPLSTVKPSLIDFIISMGGDGTILRILHHHPLIQAPILAINLGSLGFMADIQIQDIYPSLSNLLAGKFTVQTRVVMDGRTATHNDFAVNEIVIHRARNPCLIDLAIYVDNRFLNTFSADGVIIATPGGSTAYSLAAGGPIISPELNVFVLTPICPHTISNKPIVFLPNEEIRIDSIGPNGPLEITYDGFSVNLMNSGESLHITRSLRTFRLVTMLDHDYFSTLRTKLEWKGKIRPFSSN